MYFDQTNRIREASDVVKVIGHFVKLRRVGREHVGLCPFHRERSPSFSVNPRKQKWFCHGCHKGGDIFTFVELWHGVDFIGAKRFLADLAGIPWDRPLTAAEKRSYIERKQDIADMGPWRENLIRSLQSEEKGLLTTYHNARRYLMLCESDADPLFDAAGCTVAELDRKIARLESMRDLFNDATNDELLPVFRQHRRRAKHSEDLVAPIRESRLANDEYPVRGHR
jgi:hypothetical protein